MKLISNQINPHFTLTDSLHAIGSLISGKKNSELNKIFEQKFYTKNLILTNTARTALGIIADTVKPDSNKKIGLPAFICAVVATPFLARGYKIEWIDTDSNGLLDPADFAAKAPNISLVVVPHIFGQAAPLEKVIDIARQHDIFVVEDGAHLIRQLNGDKKIIADAQILSFGREKVVSCVSGGALLWPQNSPYAENFKQAAKFLPASQISWVVRHALQPLWFSLSLPWWHAGGKIIPWVLRRIKLLPLAVTAQEKQGFEDFPATTLALTQKRILAKQLTQHDGRQLHAQARALEWKTQLEPLNLDLKPIIPANAFRVLATFKNPSARADYRAQIPAKSHFHLRDWDGVPISPRGINYQNFGYRPGQCPKAEYFARTHQTWPTNIRVSTEDLKRFAKPTKST